MNPNPNLMNEAVLADDPQLPERSRLYCLTSIGTGTSDVESATSYLARLAIAHCVSTWELLKCEIAPRLFGPDANLRNRLSELLAAMGSAFNGENNTSKKFIGILSALTGRKDLCQLTMGFCHGFVGPRFLVRVKLAWCSACLSEFKSKGLEIYYPLLWQVHAVKACPHHAISLTTECPACHRSFHPLTAHTHPGYCPQCKHWLGLSVERTKDDEQLAREVATAKVMASFLRDGPKLLSDVTGSVFPNNIGRLLHSHFAGNVAALARFLNVHRYSVLAWKGGVHSPTLLSLAELSLKVGVPMVDLLCKDLVAEDFDLQAHADGQSGRRLFASLPKTDLQKMRQVLEAAAKGEMTPPPSLNQLAIQLRCNQTTLQRRFPEFTEEIKARHRQYGAIRIEVRAKLYQSIVSATVRSIHKVGLYPSQARVRDSLPRWIDMREPVAYQHWKRTLAELKLI
jgi:DNA-binding transcriptional regulator YhcF (GntR family)